MTIPVCYSSDHVQCGAHKSLFSLVMISKEELVGAGLDPEVLCVEVFKTIQALIVDAVECEVSCIIHLRCY